MDGSSLTFRAEPEPAPDVEIRVNFGMFSGREATLAEIDDLARELLGVVSHVTVEAVRRHELGRDGEAVVHQVKVEVDMPEGRRADALGERLLELVDEWARRCIEQRHAEPAEIEALP